MKISIEALTEILNLQKEEQPLIHCISSGVTMDNLAQGILSYNGKSIMETNIDEVGKITNSAKALLINLEAIDNNIIESMEKSLRITSAKSKPVVLDVVGVDSSLFRQEIVLIFLERYTIDIIKGNILEIKSLLEKAEKNQEDKSTGESTIKIKDNTKNDEEVIKYTIKTDCESREKMRIFAKRYKTILIATSTGNDNYVTDGFSEFFVANGNDKFNKIAGIDSILSGLIAVGVAIARTNAEKVQAVLIAIMAFGISKELAYSKGEITSGLGLLKSSLIDEISSIDNKTIESMGQIAYVFRR